MRADGIMTVPLRGRGDPLAVRVGTMHAMKGLEFQAVAVIGVEEGRVPEPAAITPEGEDAVVTVIARVLPEFRRRGYGAALYENGLTRARALGAGAIETVVLAANTDGVRFAEARGFVETERYVLDGETDVWITLRLA